MTNSQEAPGAPPTLPSDWRVLGAGVSAWFDAPSSTGGAALIARIAELPGSDGLDVDLRASGLRVRIPLSDAAGITPDAAALAEAISAAAQELGLAADPAALQTVRLAIEVADQPAVMSFWRAALAYEPNGANALDDPLRRDPAVSFHLQDRPPPLRNRIHVDVVRAPGAVQAVKADVGRAAYGVFGVTHADADGNEIDVVPGDELAEGADTADWQVLFGAMTFYPTTSLRQASRLATTVVGLADAAGRPLVVDLRPDGVTIDSGKDQWEDDGQGSGKRFVDLAGRIQAAAHDLALTADPTRLRFVQLGIDAVDVAAVRAFWTSVLGYQHDPRADLTDVYDPRRLNPVIIFQPMDVADSGRRRQRNRIHLDLVVPHDQAQSRIDAALAAGGRILSDATPGRHTLADPEGNEVDIVTPPSS